MSGIAIVWFRHDLRLDDQPALRAAIERGGAVVPVFVWSPDEEGAWPPGGASRWWLHESLLALEKDLSRLGSRLVLRRGPAGEELLRLAREINAESVCWNRRYEPAANARDAAVKSRLRDAGLHADSYSGSLLVEPFDVRTKDGRPFQVFTPYSRAVRALGTPDRPQPAPVRISAPTEWPSSVPLAELELAPRIDWAAGLRAEWTPGSGGASGRLRTFLSSKLDAYSTDRDRPDRDGASQLSPHLHFGEISPRRAWHAALEAVDPSSRSLPEGVEVFLRELLWREFAHHLLFHFPQTPDEPLRPAFARFPWEEDPRGLRAWQRGRTGYPIVDAGMRQLWRIGWMHNRARMIVASFLTKDLRLSWRSGAAWFWDTLVDADLANNTLGWQWSAGCGADAAPYFRIFNPVTQGKTFDPDGHYVRRWVPELARLPSQWIHAPWTAPACELSRAGIDLGWTYPSPIVDHATARAAALAAFHSLRG